MLLIGTYRLQYIIRRKAQIDMQLLTLREKLTDLQNYASSVGDGVTMDDLISCPTSMFQRMSIFKMYADQAAGAQAQQNMGLVMAMNPQLSQIQPQYQQQYQAMMYQSLFQKAEEDFGKVEKKVLNEQETKIQQQVTELETESQMLAEEKKNTEQAVQEDAKESAPKYA